MSGEHIGFGSSPTDCVLFGTSNQTFLEGAVATALSAATWNVDEQMVSGRIELPPLEDSCSSSGLLRRRFEEKAPGGDSGADGEFVAKVRPPAHPKAKFTAEDDQLIIYLKEHEFMWKEIAEYFPGRTSGTLQVRYCKKLKDRGSEWSPEMVWHIPFI